MFLNPNRSLQINSLSDVADRASKHTLAHLNYLRLYIHIVNYKLASMFQNFYSSDIC